MTRIAALSGSIRAGSSNGRLLRVAATMVPADWELHYPDFKSLPFYEPELDNHDTPLAAVAEWRAQIAGADGILVACPEYAHGVPGAFKNALDWLVSSGELSGKPTAVLMASPSGAGFARTALLPTLAVIEARIVFDASVQLARTHFDAEGNLHHAAIAAVVRDALDALRRDLDPNLLGRA